MAGSFAEARAQILSLQPATLRAKAADVRSFGAESVAAGSTLRASGDRLGAQRGTPYQAYRERVTPTAGWLTDLGRPTADTGTALENSAAAAERAQMVLAQQEEALARYAVNPAVTPAALAAAEAQALATLNTAIGEVTQAYGEVLPPQPGTAPVVAGGGSGGSGGAGSVGGATAAGSAQAGARPGSGDGEGGDGSGGVSATTGTGSGGTGGDALGPTSGPFAGFVQDPTTGNLIDPGTGRQVDAGGRFLDPITGQPFGPASPFVSRLEGLDGGVSPVGGLLGGAGGGAGAFVPGAPLADGAAGGVTPLFGAGGGGLGGLGSLGTAVGLGGAALVAGGALPFLAAGRGGGAGGRGTGFFAGLYGGVVPPSLAGNNPAAAQLRQQAAENLSVSAGTAQRYAAIASGQAQGAYLPPIAGAGIGAGAVAGGGGTRARRSGASAESEPAAVWGAGGAAGERKRKRAATSSTEVEDDDVWSGGAATACRLDGR
jgi:hypothetical protein